MKIKKDVLIQKMGDSFVAYDNETSTLHELNETGFLILSGIEKKKSKQEIIKGIVRKYKVSKNKAEGDYEEFVGALKTKDLIVGKK
ncbi:PqqD family protein [Patescibacteria group bacterium]|nr:PqqD family protein [Patescibacteria group bacterium]MBU0777220.1 PqqD family protein [Patescibacteria group bacterium]MBU0845915.1 PqqD family protein [Patescibacteria group bacterium]MBU0922942.1 PqqD family protein [Patescibacteria group bacterium]MBU1066219.1 PqqD family protein [Patescibacteria group bacterium]